MNAQEQTESPYVKAIQDFAEVPVPNLGQFQPWKPSPTHPDRQPPNDAAVAVAQLGLEPDAVGEELAALP